MIEMIEELEQFKESIEQHRPCPGTSPVVRVGVVVKDGDYASVATFPVMDRLLVYVLDRKTGTDIRTETGFLSTVNWCEAKINELEEEFSSTIRGILNPKRVIEAVIHTKLIYE